MRDEKRHGFGFPPSLIPHPFFKKSAQWESNPHFRHGKATGSRYIMGANQTAGAAGFEPTHVVLETTVLPLHHTPENHQ